MTTGICNKDNKKEPHLKGKLNKRKKTNQKWSFKIPAPPLEAHSIFFRGFFFHGKQFKKM